MIQFFSIDLDRLRNWMKMFWILFFNFQIQFWLSICIRQVLAIYHNIFMFQSNYAHHLWGRTNWEISIWNFDLSLKSCRFGSSFEVGSFSMQNLVLLRLEISCLTSWLRNLATNLIKELLPVLPGGTHLFTNMYQNQKCTPNYENVYTVHITDFLVHNCGCHLFFSVINMNTA